MLEKIIAAVAVVIFIALSVFCVLPGSFANIEIASIISEGLRTPLSEFLSAHPFIVVVAGIVFTLLAIVLPRPIKWVFLILYAGFIIYMTLLFRSQGGHVAQLKLFWSYSRFFSSEYYRMEILQNIWLFVPLGAVLYSLFKTRWMILVPLGFSVLIEVLQYFLGVGIAEFDDIISNSLGGLIGVYFALILSRSPSGKRS